MNCLLCSGCLQTDLFVVRWYCSSNVIAPPKSDSSLLLLLLLQSARLHTTATGSQLQPTVALVVNRPVSGRSKIDKLRWSTRRWPAGRTDRLPVGSGHENLNRFHLWPMWCTGIQIMTVLSEFSAVCVVSVMFTVNEDHVHFTWQTEVLTVKFIWRQCLKLITLTSNKNLLVEFCQ